VSARQSPETTWLGRLSVPPVSPSKAPPRPTIPDAGKDATRLRYATWYAINAQNARQYAKYARYAIFLTIYLGQVERREYVAQLPGP
jgi:hypothetical protein